MNVYILDRSFNKVGVIDDYTSLIWRPAYYSVGDFELYLRASSEAVALLQKNCYLAREKDMAIDFLATAGYDPEFGARPVKRAIQRYLLNDLSKKLLSLAVDRSKPIIVERDSDGLKFRN